jgi:hypothetical protein
MKMGIQQETKKDALNEGGLCCGFSLRALGLVRSPDHFELVGLCHVVTSGFQCLLSLSQVHLEGPPDGMMTVLLVDIVLVFQEFV